MSKILPTRLAIHEMAKQASVSMEALLDACKALNLKGKNIKGNRTWSQAEFEKIKAHLESQKKATQVDPPKKGKKTKADKPAPKGKAPKSSGEPKIDRKLAALPIPENIKRIAEANGVLPTDLPKLAGFKGGDVARMLAECDLVAEDLTHSNLVQAGELFRQDKERMIDGFKAHNADPKRAFTVVMPDSKDPALNPTLAKEEIPASNPEEKTSKAIRRTSSQRSAAEKRPSINGKPVKHKVWELWKNGKGITDPQQMHDAIGKLISCSTIKIWLAGWPKGEWLPKISK